ncbi:YdcH family protein, partial [Enterococcus faecium]
MPRHDERELREELIRLRSEHRDLDSEIAALEVAALSDQLHVLRLKRRKLALKDRIQAIEDLL